MDELLMESEISHRIAEFAAHIFQEAMENDLVGEAMWGFISALVTQVEMNCLDHECVEQNFTEIFENFNELKANLLTQLPEHIQH